MTYVSHKAIATTDMVATRGNLVVTYYSIVATYHSDYTAT